MSAHRSHEAQVLGRYSIAYFLLLVALGATFLSSLAANLPAVSRVLHARRLQIGLLVATTVAILGLIEVSIRLLDPLGLSYLEESSRYHLEKVADADLIYRHRSNFRSVYQGVDVSFNEIGLRERPLRHPSLNVRRILLLGDSLTFGWGVPIDETYGRKLELLAQGPAGEVVETINCGVGSYNTRQQLAFLKRHGDRIAPDLVTLLFIKNDLVPNRSPFDPWSERSFAGKSPRQKIRLALERLWTYRLALFAFELSDDRPSQRHPESPGYRDAMESLHRMGEWCNERHVGVSRGAQPRAVEGGIALRSKAPAEYAAWVTRA
jgi:hypothetical protein